MNKRGRNKKWKCRTCWRVPQPKRLCGENQYHCTACDGLRDAERRLRLLDPSHYLVTSVFPFVFDRRSGAPAGSCSPRWGLPRS